MTQTSSEGTPWDRLNKTATLASSRREIFHHDPQVVLLDYLRAGFNQYQHADHLGYYKYASQTHYSWIYSCSQQPVNDDYLGQVDES